MKASALSPIQQTVVTHLRRCAECGARARYFGFGRWLCKSCLDGTRALLDD